MLDVLRKRKRSWIIVFLLGLIILAFVVFYGGGRGQQGRLENVAEINGEAISQREFALHYERLLARYRELLKEPLTPELIKNMNLKSSLLEELIQRRLLLQEARSLGLTATDETLMNAIARMPDFQVNGRFNKERYVQLLRANRLTPGEFESEQREVMTIQNLYHVILDAVRVTEAEVRERYRVEQEKINLYFIRLPLSQFVAGSKVTEADVKNFYGRNKESFKEPARVQVEYLSYPFDRFADKVQVGDKEIEAYYEANRETKFHKLKEARVRHILVRVPAGAEADQREAARTRAQRILAEARAGKDFAQLAKENSDDPSAAQGGEIGWLTQGQMLPALDREVFGLGEGGLSGVIESPAGFHIVKVEETRAEKTQPLKEATPEIVRALKAEKAKREAARAADRDREKVLAGVDFSRLAEESNAPLKVTRWFARSEVLPGIGAAPEFYKTAFALAPKELSPVIEGADAYYLLKVKQKKEPTIPPLENVRSEIEKHLREAKASEMLTQKAGALLEQLKKRKDIKALAKEHGLAVGETGWFLRSAPQVPTIGNLQQSQPDGIVLSAAKPIPDKVVAQKNAAYLLAFKESRGADMGRFERDKERLMQEALAESQRRTMQRFIEQLKAKAQIRIQPQWLEES